MQRAYMMTAREASYGGEPAAARNAARSEMDALVARVVEEYEIIPGADQFNFVAKNGDFANLAHTAPIITDAGDMEIVGRVRSGCTLPLVAFIEYSQRRVYNNFCQRANAAYVADAAGIPAQQVEGRA